MVAHDVGAVPLLQFAQFSEHAQFELRDGQR
jgi:hypothetical protein